MIAKGSPEWPGVRRWLEEQITLKQVALESPDCRIVQTDVLRGEIAAFRFIIETVDPAPEKEIFAPISVKGAGY